MILGSHNTMSYSKPTKWWLRPFRFMAQCQSKTLEEQFDAGARLFDIRIIYKDGEYKFAHGLMEFTGDVWNALERMNNLGQYVYCRVLKERAGYESEFIKFCIEASLKYRNIRFYGGQNKKDWKQIYTFDYSSPNSIDKYSSCNYDIKDKCTGWYLDDLFPRIYAFCFNKYWRKKYKDFDGYLMQDFVGKY